MSGGDPTAVHAAQHAAPLRMRAVSRVTQNAAGSHAPGGQGGGGLSSPAVPAARLFWRAVNSGDDRLTPKEDAFVWQMRAACLTFEEIASAIIAQRTAPMRQAKSRASQLRWAYKWREDYRRERGL
jgi:hypothetical protein